MAKSLFFILTLIAFFAPSFLSRNTHGGHLYPQFYDRSCPKAQEIIKSIVAKAVAKEARMAASLVRLHFHDCFVKGCDASILLDSTGIVTGEKRSNLNRNSIRGFEVIDEIKSALEKECPRTVSCADIMTLAARDSTVLAGGPSWVVPLGRRDSNNNIPAPDNTFQTILTKFKLQGLDIVDLVALSASAQESKPILSQRVSGIVDELSGLTLLEISDLTEALRKKLGIEEMPMVAVMMPGMDFAPGMARGIGGGGGGGGEAKEEEKKEKTAFDLKLEGGYDAGAKIKIIKEVRACTDLGLKEAKDLVEKAPTLLKKGVTKDEAEKIIQKMKEIGAKVIME